MTMVTETGMLLAILIVHEIIPAVQVAAVDPAHQHWAASGAQAVHVVGTMHHDVAWLRCHGVADGGAPRAAREQTIRPAPPYKRRASRGGWWWDDGWGRMMEWCQ